MTHRRPLQTVSFASAPLETENAGPELAAR